jgi:hypothetical protein
MDETTDIVFQALLREAELVAEHLGIGATALGKAASDRPAKYVEAFFALSVGIERGAKLALSINAALNDGDYLAERDLRAYSHNMARLLDEADQIRKDRELGSEPLPDTEIHRKIVSTLTEFATNVTRYYNLEALSAANARVRSDDPIARWHKEVTQPVLRAHYSEAKRRRDLARADATQALYGPSTVVRHLTETGDLIRTVFDLEVSSAEAKAARPWERMYVLQLCRFLGRVLEGLGGRARAAGFPMPDFLEFFFVFFQPDRDFRRRKRWTYH